MGEEEFQNVQGLSDAEASLRLRTEGYNELPSARPRTVIQIIATVLSEPMLVLLLLCSLIYFFLGDPREAFILLGSALMVIGITFYQERRSERAIEALRDLSSPRALVIRNGLKKRIPGREIARGDIIIISEGDRVPADAGILRNSSLQTDESLLTGESFPVNKSEWDQESELSRPGGENLPFIYASTLIVKGRAIAEVLATGSHTEIGKIGKDLQSIGQSGTRIQTEIKSIVRIVAILGIALCVFVTILYVVFRHELLQGLLSGLSLAMAMLPEEFPVVLTVFLALGAWRMSKRHILTRRVPALETLGEVTVLCVDKTGTLTENKMAVGELRTLNGDLMNMSEMPSVLPEDFRTLAETAILASPKDPFDPMEAAIHSFGRKYFGENNYPATNKKLIKEYPLSSSLLAVTNIWSSFGLSEYVAASKGAIEAIAELCHSTKEQLSELHHLAGSMSDQGLRVLGIARAKIENDFIPQDIRDCNFEFIGLIGFYDPPKKSVSSAIEECYTAGIRIVMITGDYPGTATAIAKQIGMKFPERVMSGTELASLNPEELKDRIGEITVFARVLPEQKLSIVQALKAKGEIIAMTGDGVNDAPALKAANIGIAMGGRGTDVAREASSLVLLDDNFSTIVEAIRNGRKIFDNLQKAMSYIFAVHIPTAGMTILPILFGMPAAFFPVHIVFLELIIDPACSIAFEAELAEDNVMQRPPRNPKEKLLPWSRIDLSLLQGVVSLLISFGVYAYVLHLQRGDLEARALSFATLVFSNLGLILTNRSWSSSIIHSFKRKNNALIVVFISTIILLGIVLYVPLFQSLFHFNILHGDDIIFCITGGAASILWFEILKYYKSKKARLLR